MKLLRGLSLLSVAALVSGCIAVIRQGEVGVRNRWGQFEASPLMPGVELYNPFSTDIERVTTRTVNVEVRAQLPSKEGLTIDTEVSILYHVVPSAAPAVLGSIGPDYQNTVILSVFRSASADVSARFLAKDMHSGERANIEAAIQQRMAELLSPRGFMIEAVLLKSISLPTGLARSIEAKLQAEQESQRMVFELERERQQAEQRTLEATGIRDAQRILSEGLTESVLRFEAIKAWRELAASPNAKVIVTSPGAQPSLLIDSSQTR
jgi:prohibitin 1